MSGRNVQESRSCPTSSSRSENMLMKLVFPQPVIPITAMITSFALIDNVSRNSRLLCTVSCSSTYVNCNGSDVLEWTLSTRGRKATFPSITATTFCTNRIRSFVQLNSQAVERARVQRRKLQLKVLIERPTSTRLRSTCCMQPHDPTLAYMNTQDPLWVIIGPAHPT